MAAKMVRILVLVCFAFPVLADDCKIGDTSKIDLASHKTLHNFDDLIAGCASNFGPSGIVYHPGLDRLLVVSDKSGQYATMKTDGSDVKCIDILDTHGNNLASDNSDHEGVTFADQNDGFIFIGHEFSDKEEVAHIRQVDLSTSRIVNTWKIAFPGGIGSKDDGLESITFVRDAKHPQGGTFYIGDQTADKVAGKCDVPIRSGGDTDELYECSVEINPDFNEVSGLDYVASAKVRAQHGVVFLSSDRDDRLTAYAPDGTDLDWAIDLPTINGIVGQEGHAFNGCEFYISSDDNDDSRKVHRFAFVP